MTTEAKETAAAGFDVSVVIPLYNKAPFIRRTLESAISQTLSAREIIIVDDGSTDGGAHQIADLLNDRVKIVSQPNSGPGPARNRGIAEASGVWVAFLDADDLWLPQHLGVLAALAAKFPVAQIVASDYKSATGTSCGTDIRSSTGAPPVGSLVDFFSISVTQHSLWSSAVAVRRSALVASNGFGAFWPGEDVELWVRLAVDYPIAKTNLVTAIYTRGTGGLMEQFDQRLLAAPDAYPLFATLDRALTNPALSPLHEQISRYRDQWHIVFAKQALVKGSPRIARHYLRGLSSRARKAEILLTLLSVLPPILVQAALRLRKAYKPVTPKSAAASRDGKARIFS